MTSVAVYAFEAPLRMRRIEGEKYSRVHGAVILFSGNDSRMPRVSLSYARIGNILGACRVYTQPSRMSDQSPAVGEPRLSQFDATVLVHLDAAWNLARWLLADSALAEDAVQEACLKALKAFDKRTGPNAKPWFLAIVRNCCMDVLRGLRHRRRSDPYDDEVLLPTGNEHVDSPETAAARASEARWLHGLIDELPAEYREVLILRELEELSYKEISQIVRAPIGTVMSRLSRARDGLADKLGAKRARRQA
jgi:RNA polymerase sigma-70 factor (ECF subfamily)